MCASVTWNANGNILLLFLDVVVQCRNVSFKNHPLYPSIPPFFTHPFPYLFFTSPYPSACYCCCCCSWVMSIIVVQITRRNTYTVQRRRERTRKKKDGCCCCCFFQYIDRTIYIYSQISSNACTSHTFCLFFLSLFLFCCYICVISITSSWYPSSRGDDEKRARRRCLWMYIRSNLEWWKESE